MGQSSFLGMPLPVVIAAVAAVLVLLALARVAAGLRRPAVVRMPAADDGHDGAAAGAARVQRR